MIGKILSGIFQLIINLVSYVLSPIDAAIAKALPDLSNAFTYVANLFSYINNVIGYAIDASGLSDISIFLIVSYYTVIIGATFTVSTIKLALKWYNYLKP